LAKEKGIVDLVCYSDSLLCINIVTGPMLRFHAYVVLIQDIKELMEQTNATINHALHEGNQCVDFMAKLGALLNTDLSLHDTPLTDLLLLLQRDAARTFYLRA
jgi:hypothetical protein